MSPLDCHNQLVVLGPYQRRVDWLRAQAGTSARFSAEPGHPTRFTLNTAVLNGPYFPATRGDDERTSLHPTGDDRASSFTL